jgi:hypothetical protein
MKLTVTAGGVPPGSYVADFKALEQKDSQFGPGLLWTLEVASGPHAGAKATGMTGTKPSPANKCGKFLAGIMGRMPAVGETVDVTPFIGKRYLIVVEATEKGGSKITSITAPPTA